MNFVKIRVINFFRTQIILCILFILIIIFSLVVPNFATYKNLINIIKQVTINGIISLGLTFAILGGGLDLSVGSLFSLSGVLAISLQSRSLVLAIAAPFIAAAIVGFINGYISSKFEINSIIVTLGMLSVIAGLSLIWTNGALQLGDPNSLYTYISAGTIIGIPNYVFIFVFLATILSVILSRTILGRNIYLIGTNVIAARIAGVRVNLIRTVSFIICSICVAISSIILSSRLSSASPVVGVGYEFTAITAVLIGGNSIFGGKGSIYNTVLGVLLLGVLVNGMILLNMPVAFQLLLKGMLVIIAVFFDVRARAKLEEV